jgi:hypothetical protein
MSLVRAANGKPDCAIAVIEDNNARKTVEQQPVPEALPTGMRIGSSRGSPSKERASRPRGLRRKVARGKHYPHTRAQSGPAQSKRVSISSDK